MKGFTYSATIFVLLLFAFPRISVAADAVVTYDTRTHFGSRIASAISQQLLLSDQQLLPGIISITETRNPNGTWTFSVHHQHRLVVNFSFSPGRLKGFPSAHSLARSVAGRITG